ncbi:MAG: hypothetical protein Q8Q44_22800 [Nocardioides sp.]|nr:hypothetical protein [Nocardioides sp.]
MHGRPPPPPVQKAAPASPAAPRPRRTMPKKAAVVAKPTVRRWTPPEVFQPLVLDVLRTAGGELEVDDVFAELEKIVGEELRGGDREKTPEGELRWQYAARRARQALVTEGLMVTGRPGIWELSERGRRA